MTSFALIEAQLQSTAAYEQSDASALLFDHWYDLAKAYAANFGPDTVPQMLHETRHALAIALTTYSPDRLRDPSTDMYAVRELLRHAQKIFEILRTKPKFTALLDPLVAEEDARNALCAWLIDVGVPALEAIGLSETSPANVRVDALETLEELVRTWAVLSEHADWADAFNGDLGLGLQTTALVHVLASISTDASVRDAALNVVLVLAPLTEPWSVASTLARVARDMTALVPLWRLGVLWQKGALDVLVTRMRVGSVDQTPLRVAFCLALMESLYEALLNQKTSRVDALDAVAHVSALVRVFGTALATFQRYEAMPMEGSRRMLPDIFLQTVELVLLESPSDELLQFALDADEYSLLCVVVRSSHAFSEAAWTNLLLPYARSELAKLPLQGVSGSQRDQEVVNLIREACRLYYLNIDRVPSAALGKNVFFSVTQAIRHGYYETERFTELLALVMHRHYLLGHLQVYQWLPMLLLPTVASNLKTSRALAEALLICLGLETSSFGCENAIMSGETSKEVASTFCVILARLRTEPADIFWRDLCLHFGAFLGQHRDAMRELLASIAAELEENEARGCIAVDRVVSLSELLHAMSMRLETADDAFRLFQCGLRVVQMGVGQPTALALDSTLTNAVEKLGHIKLDDPTLDAFESALMCCAVQTRTALAHLVPQLCLEDVNAVVRQQALRHLLAREDLIKAHGITLIRSLYWIHKPIYQSVDVSSQLCLDQLSLSLEACPVLVVLARVSPLYITDVVLKLLSAADLHAMNDPLSESRFIEAHLDAVAVTGPRNALVRFALSKDGLPTLPLLVRLSAQWHQLLMDMVATGLLREETMLLLPQLYPRLERLLSKTATRFQCTAKGREVLSDAMATEDAAHQVHFWNQLHQLIAAEFERGDAMKALRMASTMKTWYPDDYSRLGTKAFVTDTIFPHVQRTAFPQCFDAPTLEAFAIYFRTMHEVKLLFPDESEKHLDISAQIDALARAKLLDVVRTSGVAAAKAWINVYGLHDLLPMLDEMHETDGPATPLLAVRVPWAATAVNVMDGELKTTSLDAIILATDKML